ncbi:MAG: hypothetical protein ACT4P4_00845 [Betaproteobacteria bacterium]
MKTLIACLSCLLAAGCAGILGSDCGANPYALGQRDGSLGATPQADLYAQRCGAPVDRAKYDAGWQDGFSRRPRPVV